jgi:hypothetical protein
MPLRAGSVRFVTDRKWQRATVLTGDVQAGKWRSCDTAPAEQSEGGIVIKVSPDQAFRLLLVTESGSAAKWCRTIERAMNDPARLP